MKVPTVVARSILAYIRGGGAGREKAEVMLRAMGWNPDGTRASTDEIEEARELWKNSMNTL